MFTEARAMPRLLGIAAERIVTLSKSKHTISSHDLLEENLIKPKNIKVDKGISAELLGDCMGIMFLESWKGSIGVVASTGFGFVIVRLPVTQIYTDTTYNTQTRLQCLLKRLLD